MSNTEQTKKDIDEWMSEERRTIRYVMLREMAKRADIYGGFVEVPHAHFMNMDYDKFMINVLAMAKIRELRRIGDKE